MENNVRVSGPILEAMSREAQRTGVDVNGLFDEAAKRRSVSATRAVVASSHPTPCAWSARTAINIAAGDPRHPRHKRADQRLQLPG
jgi:hypothetical protein